MEKRNLSKGAQILLALLQLLLPAQMAFSNGAGASGESASVIITPGSNNTVHSLIFTNNASLTIDPTNQLTVVSGNLNVQTGKSVVWGGNLNTSGSLQKLGAGELDLQVSAKVNGIALVNEGSLSVNGQLKANSFVVQPGATLGGAGTIIASDVVVNGTLSAGNPPGTLNILGNMSLTEGSLWMVEIASPWDFDRVVVSGTAILAGTLNAVEYGGGTIFPGTSYEILSACRGITGAFSYIIVPEGLRARFLNLGTVGILVFDSPLSVESSGMVAWSERAAFADSLTASGGVPPYAWQISAGSLPTGLSLSQDGVVSGTPTTGGTSNFTVRVVDSEGYSAEGQLKIRIIPKVSSGGGVFFRNLAGTLFGTYIGSGDASSFTGSAHGSGGFSGSADGTGGFSFTGSAADSPTAFNSPSGITVDSAGNIFVGDSGNHAIRKIFTDGRVENFVGSFSGSSDQSLGGSFTGPGTRDDWGLQAEFNNPQGLAADGSGNLFVAESGSHRIRKVSPFGQVSHYVGGVGFSGSADGSPTAARFNKPSDVAVDSSGNIFVADSGNHAIRRIAANGTVSTWAGTMGAAGNTNGNGTAARFRSPQGVAVDGSGNVYVADTGNSMIRRISANRTVTTLAGAAFTGSAGEQYGRASFTGSAYAAFLGSAGPDFPQSVDGNATTSRFSFPTDIEVDTAGNLYVTDSGSSKIRKISTNGTVTTLGNSPDGFFFNPLDLAVSANGTIFVADTGDNRIAMTFTPTPEITIELPGGVSLSNNQSASPFAVALLQTNAPRTYTVRNTGYANLTGIAVSKNGTSAADFAVGSIGATTLAPGNSTTFTVTFTPSSGGNRTAQLAVASNDPVNNPFRVNLAGFGLSSTLDSDGDGVSDAAEFQMGSLGFDWQSAQADKASAFLAGVNAGGLYNTSQIQAMNIGTPMISKNTSTGRFELTVGVQKSTNLQTFQHFSLNNTETTIEPDGTLKIRFNATENAAFFRLQAK